MLIYSSAPTGAASCGREIGTVIRSRSTSGSTGRTNCAMRLEGERMRVAGKKANRPRQGKATAALDRAIHPTTMRGASIRSWRNPCRRFCARCRFCQNRPWCRSQRLGRRWWSGRQIQRKRRPVLSGEGNRERLQVMKAEAISSRRSRAILRTHLCVMMKRLAIDRIGTIARRTGTSIGGILTARWSRRVSGQQSCFAWKLKEAVVG
jgi:hypothetical protein